MPKQQHFLKKFQQLAPNQLFCWLQYKIMIRLQVAVSNLKPTNYQEDPIDQISLKFGSISTTLQLVQGHGGKSLFLQFTEAEMLQIYQLYACGLFIQNRKGRYFSLLNLQQLKLGDKVVCQQIYFSNDSRETKFKCEFSIASNAYNSPKIPNMTNIQQRQNGLNLLKKPPVPKQQTAYNNFVSSEENKVPNSFLYGNKLSKTQSNFKTDNLQTLKQGLRKQHQVKSSLQKSKNKIPQKSHQIMAKKPQIKYEQQDLLVDNPPMMEFTNDQQTNNVPSLKVPQIQYIEYADSIDHSNKQRKSNKLSSTEPKFATFNRNASDFKQRGSPQAPSEFQLLKTQNVQLPPKPKTLSKQQIKKLAKKDAEQKQIKDNVMVPLVKGDKFQLVPLSKLKPQQIIQYVQKQRKNEQKAYANQLLKQKLERQQKEMQEKSKRLQLQMQKRERQRASFERQATQKKKNSLQSKESFTGLIKEEKESQIDEESQQNNDNQDEYMSDFQSMTGSVIKSRISSRGGNYKNMPKQEQSAGLEDEYSQEFDSYSHSALSKTNLNRNKVPSISDYSDSYRSISQSYGKH